MTNEEWAALALLLWRQAWMYATPNDRRELLAIQQRIDAARCAPSKPEFPAVLTRPDEG